MPTSKANNIKELGGGLCIPLHLDKRANIFPFPLKYLEGGCVWNKFIEARLEGSDKDINISGNMSTEERFKKGNIVIFLSKDQLTKLCQRQGSNYHGMKKEYVKKRKEIDKEQALWKQTIREAQQYLYILIFYCYSSTVTVQ